ncbi:MAG: FAD-dependent oxidoreductase, partial [Sphingobacteriales bacterium]
MMRRLIFTVVLMFQALLLLAQTAKPGVLVVGNGNAATTAALQSAISGVKTTLLLQAGGFDISPIGNNLSSGLEATFLQKIRDAKEIKDSTQSVTFDKQLANDVLKKWTDSLKNLTIVRNVMWVKAEKSSSAWTLKLSDGSSIRAKILINPSDAKLNEAMKITVQSTATFAKIDFSNTLYRTSVTSGKNADGTATYFSLYNFLIPVYDNLVWISDTQSMLVGQAAGATAAYSAFYSTKTSQSNLKKIQGELINYKLNVMPYADIKLNDTNWKAIQFVGSTGVLKANLVNGNANFSPNQLVTTAEIKQPFKDFYYKAQIWFDDYKNEQMTIGSALDMICYVGNKALENTKKELTKNWKTNYQFKTEFDLERPINRVEFAVMLQDYMSPFNVNIDKNGKV